MLALLDIFTAQRHVWTVEAMAAHCNYTSSSAYRYVRELCRAGLLVRMPGGGYVIGARVVELESLIRETDPLTKVCEPMLVRIAQQLGCHSLLSNVYGDHLINVAHIVGTESIDLAFVRGRRLPWFVGAPSMSILAFLPRKRVKKLFDDHYGGERTKESWRLVLSELKGIADAGYCVSVEQLQSNVVGFGAPVIVDGEVMGSISLACSRKHAEFLNRDAVGKLLKDACAECAAALASNTSAEPVSRSDAASL